MTTRMTSTSTIDGDTASLKAAAKASGGELPRHAPLPMTGPALRIARESPRQPAVIALLDQSDAYMNALYPPESNHLLGVTALEHPAVDFLVARRASMVVGCGALVPAEDGSGEIKRLFVCAQARGTKVGYRLMTGLQDRALARGLHTLRLEAGVHQPEALALYRGLGFREIGPFGNYLPDPLSVFMEKKLAAAAD